jgi:hypothetical protein
LTPCALFVVAVIEMFCPSSILGDPEPAASKLSVGAEPPLLQPPNIVRTTKETQTDTPQAMRFIGHLCAAGSLRTGTPRVCKEVGQWLRMYQENSLVG